MILKIILFIICAIVLIITSILVLNVIHYSIIPSWQKHGYRILWFINLAIVFTLMLFSFKSPFDF